LSALINESKLLFWRKLYIKEQW